MVTVFVSVTKNEEVTVSDFQFKKKKKPQQRNEICVFVGWELRDASCDVTEGWAVADEKK